MKPWTRRALWAVGMMAMCAPVSVALTLLLIPLWRWIEATYGIESIGHSGPADWCFAAVYAASAGACVIILWRRERRR